MGKANCCVHLFYKIDDHGEFGCYIKMDDACIIAKQQCMDGTYFNEKIFIRKQKCVLDFKK